MELKKVGFFGLGLIGGSIAKKMKENHPKLEIIATASRQTTVTDAYQSGLIQNEGLLKPEAFSDCDLIFLCAPVGLNLEYLEKLKTIIKPGCLITDVGSTKGDIHRKVIDLDMEESFVGGHPMTGSEKTGIRNADGSILKNAYYIITPTAKTLPATVSFFENLVAELGSIPLVLDYDSHDHATAAISHLPHMIAYTLVNLVKDEDDTNETLKTIAAGGFKDITRIASSSPVMWQNICQSNKTQLLTLMDHYFEKLNSLREKIANDEQEALLEYFQTAKDYRDSIALPNSKRRSNFHEIYLDLDDKAGEIATIATILGQNGISIRNIGIINNREFEEGVLRIEFYDDTSNNNAVSLLTHHGYQIYKHE